MTNTLTAVSLMASTAIPFHQAVTEYLAARTASALAFVRDRPWREQAQLLEGGQAQLGFVCGIQYTRWAKQVALLAAPVMRAPRYAGQPIYYSDVVVRHASDFDSFAGLRGARWAWNEPGSFSGHVVVQAHVAALGEQHGYFASVCESGGHVASIDLVLQGTVDAAAIDSTVFDHILTQQPAVASALRSVATLGPNPCPPVVIARSVSLPLRQALQHALTSMHSDPVGLAILAVGQVERFVLVDDADYAPIRQVAAAATGVQLLLGAVMA